MGLRGGDLQTSASHLRSGKNQDFLWSVCSTSCREEIVCHMETHGPGYTPARVSQINQEAGRCQGRSSSAIPQPLPSLPPSEGQDKPTDRVTKFTLGHLWSTHHLPIISENCLGPLFLPYHISYGSCTLGRQGSRRQKAGATAWESPEQWSGWGCHWQIGNLEITPEFQISMITVPQAE